MVLGGEPPGRVGRRRDISSTQVSAMHRADGGAREIPATTYSTIGRSWQTRDDAAGATARAVRRRSVPAARVAARPAGVRGPRRRVVVRRAEAVRGPAEQVGVVPAAG